MLVIYILSITITLFLSSMVFFIVRDWWQEKNKPTGIYRDYEKLHDDIKYASHPVEIAFLTNQIMEFEADHRGEKECMELYKELMLFAHQKELSLTGRMFSV